MESDAFKTSTTKDVVRMATLLRDKGDRLLNFSCKLTLTVDFLLKLNEAFDLIVENVDTSYFQVINTNNSSIDFLHDLQFLHDFVQKILGVRLWCKSRNTASVRLEKFRSLQYLDLHDVSVKNIKISCLRDKLKSLSCTHCNLQNIKDLIVSDDEFGQQNRDSECSNSEQQWHLLEELFLPYNSIVTLDSSLMYLPRLKLLDLSHNHLNDLSALDHSTGNLELLNISYNRLKSIPVISSCTKLKVLLVNDNQVKNIVGLKGMPSLQQIDASNNILRHHMYLQPLSNLIGIEKLHLQGNPIAFHTVHRLLTIYYLHPLVMESGKLQVDGHMVSPRERSIFNNLKGTEGVFNSEYRRGSSWNSFTPSTPEEGANSESRNIAPRRQATHSHSLKVGVPAGSRPLRIREVSIDVEEECVSYESKSNNRELAPAFEDAVHLKTKREIEALREKIGEEEWLHGGGGQKVINILGLPMRTPVASTSLAPVDETSPPQPSVVEPTLEQVVHQSDSTVKASYDEAEEVQVGVDGGGGGDGAVGSDDKQSHEEESHMEDLQNQEEKENGVELGVFIVQKRRAGHSLPMDDLLLRVTDRLLIECNVATGMEMAKRTMSNLVAVSQGVVSEDDSCRKSVRLTFRDSYSMETLLYLMEDEESKELLKVIGGMLEMKYSNSKESSIQFTCMRCCTTFVPTSTSSDTASHGMGMKQTEMEGDTDVSPKCPKCNSVAVVQIIEEEASNFQEPSDVTQMQRDGILSSEGEASQRLEPKDPIANWAEINLINEVTTSNEAFDHGLKIHILLNILPDGQGKEFDVQEVLVFQGNPSDAFCGYIVISADNIYVLKGADALKTEERRSSGDEHGAPTLVEQYSTHCCLSVNKIHSSYSIKFGNGPTGNLCLFPRHHKQMEDVMEALCSSLKDKKLLLNEDQGIDENSKLSEVIKFFPASAITCLTSISVPLDPFIDGPQYGILVLTSSVIFFVNHMDIEMFFFNSEYVPSYERRIADLVSLNGAISTFQQLNGILLHFSSEEHDDMCIVWPWGDGALLDLLYTLQKPWENIFSVPFETILAQPMAIEL